MSSHPSTYYSSSDDEEGMDDMLVPYLDPTALAPAPGGAMPSIYAPYQVVPHESDLLIDH